MLAAQKSGTPFACRTSTNGIAALPHLNVVHGQFKRMLAFRSLGNPSLAQRATIQHINHTLKKELECLSNLTLWDKVADRAKIVRTFKDRNEGNALAGDCVFDGHDGPADHRKAPMLHLAELHELEFLWGVGS